MTSWDGTAFRERIQAVLDEFLDEMAGRLAPLGPDAVRLLDEARASVGGGKRFFPDGVRLDLDLVEQRAFKSGLIYARYRTR